MGINMSQITVHLQSVIAACTTHLDQLHLSVTKRPSQPEVQHRLPRHVRRVVEVAGPEGRHRGPGAEAKAPADGVGLREGGGGVRTRPWDNGMIQACCIKMGLVRTGTGQME